MVEYTRPKTRGELRDKLKAGMTCEIPSYLASMTSIMLRGWLEFEDFTTMPSENKGRTLFLPTVPAQETS